MFAFHRPKIYRSLNGCCICKAKSSSSRFTDSKKYENEFKMCFDLGEEQKRAGEICNACVLLIKRWKKLPKGTERNWNHVVDARAGPGGKTLLRNKLKHSPFKSPTSSGHSCCNLRKRKHRSTMRMRKMRLMDRLPQMPREDADKAPLSPTASESSTDDMDDLRSKGINEIRHKEPFPIPPYLRAILDTTYWKVEHICCGTIFKGCRGEVLIEPTLFKPCTACSNPSTRHAAAFKTPDTNRESRSDSVGSEDSLEISDREMDECTESNVLESLVGLSGASIPTKGMVV